MCSQRAKKPGLNVDDRIELVLTTDSDDLRAAIDEHCETIQAETLAVSLGAEGAKEYGFVLARLFLRNWQQQS